jgi:selenocysteine lyase/cysteine desulfurase
MDLEKNLNDIRKEFKLLNYWTFLNAADQMIPGNYWIEAMRDYLTFVEAGRTEDIPVPDVATHPFLTATFFETIERAARLIHADKEEVINIYRPMTAANLIIYNVLDWKRGDNVVFTDLEYPSIPYILADLERRYGVELRRVKNVNGEILLEDLEKAIDDNTKLVVINRTEPFSGFTFTPEDLKRISDIAHKHGALVLDDPMQAAGAIDINVHEDGIDFAIAGSYKWLCGPEGAGFMYIRKDLISKFDPRFRNYLWADIPTGIPFSLPDHDNVRSWDYPPVNSALKFSQDVCNTPALFGWNATLKFYEKIGIENVEKRVRYLGTYTIEKLKEIGCRVLTPEDPRKRHGLIVYTTGSYESDLASFNYFSSRRKPIKVSLRALGGIGGIRVSTHFFNTEEEIDELIAAQKEMLSKK